MNGQKLKLGAQRKQRHISFHLVSLFMDPVRSGQICISIKIKLNKKCNYLQPVLSQAKVDS